MKRSRVTFYDGFKDRCYAWFFLGMLLTVGLIWFMARQMNLDPRFIWFVGGTLGAAWISGFIRHWRAGRGARWKYQPLSCDEIIKARSKLMRCQNWKR